MPRQTNSATLLERHAWPHSQKLSPKGHTQKEMASSQLSVIGYGKGQKGLTQVIQNMNPHLHEFLSVIRVTLPVYEDPNKPKENFTKHRAAK